MVPVSAQLHVCFVSLTVAHNATERPVSLGGMEWNSSVVTWPNGSVPTDRTLGVQVSLEHAIRSAEDTYRLTRILVGDKENPPEPRGCSSVADLVRRTYLCGSEHNCSFGVGIAAMRPGEARLGVRARKPIEKDFEIKGHFVIAIPLTDTEKLKLDESGFTFRIVKFAGGGGHHLLFGLGPAMTDGRKANVRVGFNKGLVEISSTGDIGEGMELIADYRDGFESFYVTECRFRDSHGTTHSSLVKSLMTGGCRLPLFGELSPPSWEELSCLSGVLQRLQSSEDSGIATGASHLEIGGACHLRGGRYLKCSYEGADHLIGPFCDDSALELGFKNLLQQISPR